MHILSSVTLSNTLNEMYITYKVYDKHKGN